MDTQGFHPNNVLRIHEPEDRLAQFYTKNLSIIFVLFIDLFSMKGPQLSSDWKGAPIEKKFKNHCFNEICIDLYIFNDSFSWSSADRFSALKLSYSEKEIDYKKCF